MSPQSTQLLYLPLPCGTWFPSNPVPSPPVTRPCAHSVPASGLLAVPVTSQAFSSPRAFAPTICSSTPSPIIQVSAWMSLSQSLVQTGNGHCHSHSLSPQPASVSFYLYFMGFLVYYLPLVMSSLWEDICPLLCWCPLSVPICTFSLSNGKSQSPSFQPLFLVPVPSGPQYFAIPWISL